MSTVFNIPLTTLSTGQRIRAGFGGSSGKPVSIPDSAEAVTIAVDRTAGADSLNSLSTNEHLHMAADISMDGGATWMLGYVEFICDGGIYINRRTGQRIDVSSVGPLTLPVGTGRLVRGEVDSIAGTISFAGTITLTP